MLADNSQFNSDGAGNNDHQYGFLRVMAMNALGLLPGQSGSPAVGLPSGRAAAASSVPVVLSTEDKAALNQSFKRAAAVSATAGDALWLQGVTTAGTVTITLANGGTLVVTVALGSTILPFSATAAALTTAVGGTFQSLFFT